MNKKKIVLYISLIIFIFLIIVIFIDMFFSFNKDNIIFELNGDSNVIIFEGEDYIEESFKALYDGEDISTYVNVEGMVDNKRVGTYTISYVLNYKSINIKLERNVTVLENRLNNYEIILNGDSLIYVLLGSDLLDPGYKIVDENKNNVKLPVEIINNVNVLQSGEYTIEYILKMDKFEKKAVRKVIVYNMDYSVNITPNEKTASNVKIEFKIKDKNNYEKIVLPDGTSSNMDEVTYLVKENGIYRFLIYDKYGDFQEEIVEVKNILKDYTCVGTISRNGTSLIVNGSDLNSIKEYQWNIDGSVISGERAYKNSLKAVDKASVSLIIGNSKLETACNITNNLPYKFVYDENNQKPYVKCDTYTENDRIYYENILINSINQAGYQTRAGVVEAARFLVGGLEYKIKYLGPKTVNSKLGRYEKIGLNIGYKDGWGCMVSGWTQGMDCTNFVRWAFIQADLKVGNIYSKSNTYSIIDALDRIKVGDLLLTPKDDSFSHVGIIIGIDNNFIYVAESTTGNINAIVVTKLDKTNLPKKGKFSVVRLYNYANDGNITNMWIS